MAARFARPPAQKEGPSLTRRPSEAGTRSEALALPLGRNAQHSPRATRITSAATVTARSNSLHRRGSAGHSARQREEVRASAPPGHRWHARAPARLQWRELAARAVPHARVLRSRCAAGATHSGQARAGRHRLALASAPRASAFNCTTCERLSVQRVRISAASGGVVQPRAGMRVGWCARRHQTILPNATHHPTCKPPRTLHGTLLPASAFRIAHNLRRALPSDPLLIAAEARGEQFGTSCRRCAVHSVTKNGPHCYQCGPLTYGAQRVENSVLT